MPGPASVRGSPAVVGIPDDSWLFTAPECMHRPAFCLLLQADCLVVMRSISIQVTLCLETRYELSSMRQIRSRLAPRGIARKSSARIFG